MRLNPLEYLVPLGPDPRTGLWEFAHALTGEPPRRAPDGSLELTESSAVVLVLIPGGGARRGSQLMSPELPNYDPAHQRLEQPVLPFGLDPFFLSKYELTLAQWERLTGRDASKSLGWTPPSRMAPATAISWEDAVAVLACIGLTLPSEAQWEYAARAGTTTPWWTGQEHVSLLGAANLGEPALRPTASRSLCPAGPDGWINSSPVGSLRANPFGLYDVHGNAAEFVRDIGMIAYDYRNVLFGTGERAPFSDHARSTRQELLVGPTRRSQRLAPLDDPQRSESRRGCTSVARSRVAKPGLTSRRAV